MLCKRLHRRTSNLLRQPLLLCLRPIIQKLFLILKPDRILPNHGSGVSCPLILQMKVPSILIHIHLLLHHLAFPLDFNDTTLVVCVSGDISSSHLGHPAEDVVQCATSCRCLIQHHFEL